MASDGLKREVPCRLIVAVVLVLVSHICVLVANLRTAGTLELVGGSTYGWSSVAVDLAHSLQDELSVAMHNVTGMLSQSINQSLFVQDILDTVVALAGTASDQIANHDTSRALSLLQAAAASGGAAALAGPLDALPALVLQALDDVLRELVEKALQGLDLLLKKMKPALVEVGHFVARFGDRIQAYVRQFSITLDKAQKLFDHVMSSLSLRGAGEAQMRQHTFNLFDVSNTGHISAQDLKEVSRLYGVTALAGPKSDEMVHLYDQDNDSVIDDTEFALLVHDVTIPDAMVLVLRQYARKLSEAAGEVAAARYRDEVAQSVVNYLRLVCAKNKTKVGWIADRLTNDSLPLEFTADLLATMAMQADDPDVLTSEEVGGVVVGRMMELRSAQTLAAFRLLENSTYWEGSGFDILSQPGCLQRLRTWMGTTSLLELDSGRAATVPRESDEERARSHAGARAAEHRARHQRLFASPSSQTLLMELLGGVPAGFRSYSIGGGATEADRAVRLGTVAAPETQEFARWLAWNATRTAQELQQLCFGYSSQSSSMVDSFATQLEGVTQKFSLFLTTMQKYASQQGIARLEQQVRGFASSALNDVVKLAEREVGVIVNRSAPGLVTAVHGTIQQAANSLGHALAESLATPLGQALVPVFKASLNSTLGNDTAERLSRDLGLHLSSDILQHSGDALGPQLAQLMEEMVVAAFRGAANLVNDTLGSIPQIGSLVEVPVASVFTGHGGPLHEGAISALSTKVLPHKVGDATQLAAAVRGAQDAIVGAVQPTGALLGLSEDAPAVDSSEDLVVSGVWDDMVEMLRSFIDLLPQAVKTLKSARTEVNRVQATLDSLFAILASKGPDYFNHLSSRWSAVWITYFCSLVPLTLGLLVYGFWAGGFFRSSDGDAADGPDEQPKSEDENASDAEEARSLTGMLRACWASLTHCFRTNVRHDDPLFFWSLCLLLEFVVFVVFFAATFLCSFALAKVLLLVSCSELHILSSGDVCGQSLGHVRTWLNTFHAQDADLPGTCRDRQLLTCDLISQRLAVNGAISTSFAIVASVFTFHLLVEGAMMHTRAVVRGELARKRARMATLAETSEM